MAPEIILGTNYRGIQTDLFAVGVILFMMRGARPPFGQAKTTDPYYRFIAGNRSDIFWKAHTRNNPEGLNYYSADFRDLFTSLI